MVPEVYGKYLDFSFINPILGCGFARCSNATCFGLVGGCLRSDGATYRNRHPIKRIRRSFP